MPKTETTTVLAAARRSLSQPVDYDEWLAKVGQRDRTNIDRHVTACETESDDNHANLWRTVACALATLAPLPPQTIGQHALMFFVADGKYRMQAFALEDQRDGRLLIYLPDAMKEAIKAGVIQAAKPADGPQDYPIGGHKGHVLHIESLDAANTPNPAAHYKNMLGWNRKALLITLPTDASEAQIAATKDLCALAARQWTKGEK